VDIDEIVDGKRRCHPSRQPLRGLLRKRTELEAD
jgi:hypothetical protein